MKKNRKINCWEFKKCGRQPGGSMAAVSGVCPAAGEQRLDAVHGGKNAGRACWVIAGTMCKGVVQGTFAQKFKDCSTCEFYDMVKSVEGKDFILTINLLGKIS